MSWDRKLWGIEFRGSMKKDPPMLLGELWDDTSREAESHYGCPTRALLFTTRDAARAWCDVKNAEYLSRNDFCNKWRVRPVRVRETVVKLTAEPRNAVRAFGRENKELAALRAKVERLCNALDWIADPRGNDICTPQEIAEDALAREKP